MEISPIPALISEVTGPLSRQTVAREIDALFFKMLLKTTNLFETAMAGEAGAAWSDFFLSELANELAAQEKLGFGNMILSEEGHD